MSSKLGLHIISAHRDNRDREVWREMQPPVIKLFDSEWTDNALVQELLRDLPNTLFVMRHWPWSEQHDDMRSDPVGTATRHARNWAMEADQRGWPRNRMVMLGINEPTVWTHRDQAVLYTTAFLDGCRGYGLRAGALGLSVGWPDNTGPGTPVDWVPYESVLRAIQRGNHVLVLHEYWDRRGPQHNWKWWSGRYLQCPWQVPIVIGECGLDQAVSEGGEHRGWQHFLTPAQYIAQLAWYDQQIRQDSRIIGATIFTYDYAGREWWSFNVRAIREELLAYMERLSPMPPPKPTPEDAFSRALLAEGQRQQVLRLNPQAAIQKVLLADNFIPTSGEFEFVHSGTTYIAQRAERLSDGAVRVYYCRVGDWSNVKSVSA